MMLFSLALIIVHICIVFYDTVMLENAVACSSLTGSVGNHCSYWENGPAFPIYLNPVRIQLYFHIMQIANIT